MAVVHNRTLINLILFSALLSCSHILDKTSGTIDSPHPGMKKIMAAGKSFQQGWNGADASLDEKPGMLSSFSHDYWLDTTEVTQKQFYEHTGRRPVTDSFPYGVGDNNPVYNVTWYDAVLFCNARSRTEDLDTVYSYFRCNALSNGSVSELIGMQTDYSRDGYRLPTEAEWEFAARGGSSTLPFTAASDSLNAQHVAWYVANSNGTTHPVATKMPNSFGLYDMAGNVFEWTNDWKCFYTNSAITNSLGAPQPNAELEKVIKGGSFDYSLLYLRPSHRSATYATTVSYKSEFIGLRCARGIIADGHYIGMVQQDTIPNPASVIIGRDSLQSLLGTFNVKLVFVNVNGSDRLLSLVDFSKSLPFVINYTDDKNVYMPTISPDGKYVAYCSRNVGLSGPSKITIRSLDSLNSPMIKIAADTAYIPRWWVDASNSDIYIIYTNSAVDNGNSLWGSTKTYLQKISGGNPIDSPRILISNGSYHDGLSASGRYTVTSYTRLMLRDLQTGQENQLFLSPYNGKEAGGSSQVCNGSISPDTGGNPQCMFLDFGSSAPSTVTKCSYGIHQYIFISSIVDSITNFMRCPNGEDSWEYPKWSNQVQFAVACGANSSGQSHSVYVVDLKNRASFQILTGTEIEQPFMWMATALQNPFTFALDSLAQYNDPPSNDYGLPTSTWPPKY